MKLSKDGVEVEVDQRRVNQMKNLGWTEVKEKKSEAKDKPKDTNSTV